MRNGLKVLLAVVAVALTATAATLAANSRSAASDTLVFGTAADPIVLDGALVSDGESLRVIDQIFERLVGAQARDHESSSRRSRESGRRRTTASRGRSTLRTGRDVPRRHAVQRGGGLLQLRPLVQLHRRSLQNSSARTTGYTVFGGLARPAGQRRARRTALYKSCKAVDEHDRRDHAQRPSSSFLGALSLTCVRDRRARRRSSEVRRGRGHGRRRTASSTRAATFGAPRHPVGTGPFKFESWKIGDKLVLVRNDELLGQEGEARRRVIFRPISDNAARLQALQTGRDPGLRPRRAAGHRRRSRRTRT